MLQNQPFDKVIRKVEKGVYARHPTQKLLVVAKKKGEVKILQKEPMLSSLLGSELTYYIVGNEGNASNIAENSIVCTVRDFNGNRHIDIIIRYEASCPSGHEENVVLSLCGGLIRPTDELHNKIKACVAEYNRSDGGRFIDNHLNQLPILTDKIETTIQQGTGLSFKALLTLDKERELQNFSIKPIAFGVRVVDCDDELDLQVQTELVVDEVNKVKAILNDGRLPILVNLIKDEIKKYLRKNISIQRFYSALNTSVRDELIDHLNRLLLDYGRRIDFLVLASSTASSVPVRFEEIQCQINCEIYDPEQISFDINNTLQLELKDVAKYRIAQTPNLKEWVKEFLTPIVKTALFQSKYIDVLLNFKNIETGIKVKMQTEAQKIGYSVDQIVSIPKLEPIECTKVFDLKIEKENFSLKEYKVEVSLNIVTTLCIPNLKDIADELSPTVNLKESIRQEILVTVHRFLNKVEPERFYMRFSDPDLQLGERQSVEEELQKVIDIALKKRFYAQVSSVVIRTLDTKIKSCYESLFRKICSFDLSFKSLKDTKPVHLSGDFQINGVERFSWHVFQERIPNLNDINECIKKSIRSRLSNLPSELLNYNNIETLKQLEQLVEQVATESVSKQFGILIIISNLNRELTKSEQLQSELDQKIEEIRFKEIATNVESRNIELDTQLQIGQISNAAKVSELQKLLIRRESIILNEEHEEELKEINKKIWELQSGFSYASIEEAETRLNSMRSQETNSQNLIDFSEQLKSLPAKTNDQAIKSDKSDNE